MSKIRRVRENLGLTQPELARLSGVSVRTIARAEDGEHLKEVTWSKILKGMNSVANLKKRLNDIR